MELKENIRKIMAEILETEPDEIDDNTPYTELGLDSFALLESIVNLENEYSISIEEDQIPQMTNISKTAEIIENILENTK